MIKTNSEEPAYPLYYPFMNQPPNYSFPNCMNPYNYPGNQGVYNPFDSNNGYKGLYSPMMNTTMGCNSFNPYYQSQMMGYNWMCMPCQMPCQPTITFDIFQQQG